VSPLLAQAVGTTGYQFVDAVRTQDGDKAMELFNSAGPRIVNAKDVKGDTGLIAAIGNGDDRFTAFLLSKGADPNLGGKDGETPLTTAARGNYTDAVQWLISEGAKVNIANRRGETPLIIAVQQREPRIVKLLLQAGADPDKADSIAGFSARDYASRDSRSHEIIDMMPAKKGG
jgi:ankyrin repeat protein